MVRKFRYCIIARITRRLGVPQRQNGFAAHAEFFPTIVWAATNSFAAASTIFAAQGHSRLAA